MIGVIFYGKKLILKKCDECGALIKIIKDCNCADCGIECCGKKMVTLKPNSVDAAVEKHVPTYEKDGDDIIVTVSHVMEEGHYIEWISLVSENKEKIIYLKPGMGAKVTFKNVKNGNLYSYCNKHGLWENKINL